MDFYLYVSYDDQRDDFYAMVTDGSDGAQPIFEIDDTAEMVAYIEQKVMSHIDDTDGLKKHMVHNGLMNETDNLLIVEKALV